MLQGNISKTTGKHNLISANMLEMFYNIFTKWLQEKCVVMFQKVYPKTDY